jgi:hypothetical protein
MEMIESDGFFTSKRFMRQVTAFKLAPAKFVLQE